MPPQLLLHFAWLILAGLLLPASVYAQGLKFKTCSKPLPLQLKPFTHKPQRIDFLCGNTGCHKGQGSSNDEQNAMKNNFCAPVTRLMAVTLSTFGDLGNASNNAPTIPKGEPPPSRAKLTDIITLGDGTKLGEGKTVTFVGYVLDARHSNVDKDDPLTKGNGESVQCNLLGCAYNDIHITLAEDPNETALCKTIVAEIIPHYRPAAWDLFDSPDYTTFLKTHPVKISGQLFFDGSHVACMAGGKAGFNPITKHADFERLALWEIHPIYAIDVCKHTDKSQCRVSDPSAWFPFSKLKSRLGLASVSPTEKCKATTDDPKSACPGFTLPGKKKSPD
ncbi:MAG TPA: hypothetical protein VK582_22065 [Pyrinomonadaceae bacterium]|nr:hypothetical protein [Pyrinomonadaceae bacterium]